MLPQLFLLVYIHLNTQHTNLINQTQCRHAAELLLMGLVFWFCNWSLFYFIVNQINKYNKIKQSYTKIKVKFMTIQNQVKTRNKIE